jgi:hypothetical protein
MSGTPQNRKGEKIFAVADVRGVQFNSPAEKHHCRSIRLKGYRLFAGGGVFCNNMCKKSEASFWKYYQ